MCQRSGARKPIGRRAPKPNVAGHATGDTPARLWSTAVAGFGCLLICCGCMARRGTDEADRDIFVVACTLFGLALIFVPTRILIRHEVGAKWVGSYFGQRAACIYGAITYRLFGGAFLCMALYMLSHE